MSVRPVESGAVTRNSSSTNLPLPRETASPLAANALGEAAGNQDLGTAYARYTASHTIRPSIMMSASFTNARNRPALSGMVATKYVNDRQRDDAQVEPDRPIFNVVQIIPDPFLQVGSAAEIVDLCPAGNARLDQVLLHVTRDLLLETMDEFRTLRPRPDDRHLALEDIDELRKLVQAGPPKERAEGRGQLFAPRCPYRSRLGLCIYGHRPEFEHLKALAIPGNPFLAIEDGPRR